MHQNNINKITCIKITLTKINTHQKSINKITCTNMTLVKPLFKTSLSNDNIFS